MVDRAKAEQQLVWIDLEMTGLDVEKEVIIEIAAVITDLDFNNCDNYHAVIQQPRSYLDQMDEWNKSHHGKSGLLKLIPDGIPLAQADLDLSQLLKQHFGDTPAIIAGNSIAQDRLFINKYMPTLQKRLHYRMLDVSAWKIWFEKKLNRRYKKKNTHRALDDIQESIEEFKFYLTFIAAP